MITYKTTLENITSNMLDGFCVGWTKPLNGEQLFKILNNSGYFVLAIEEETNKIVGFVNALSDMVHFAFIPMIEVLPEYKNQKIGTNLLLNLFNLLSDITCIDLACDEELQPYYEKFDMLKSKGMLIRKFLTEEQKKWYRENC